MARDRALELDVGSLVERHVERAGLLVVLDGKILVALDADTEEFVALPTPASTGVDNLKALSIGPVALSYDGTQAVLHVALAFEKFATSRVVLYRLSTGDERRIRLPEGEHIARTAFSPDGRHLAVSVDRGDEYTGQCHLDVVDLGTYTRRRLWSADGAANVHLAGVGWSPDGQYLAVSYVMREEDVFAAAVVTVDGALVAHYQGVEPIADNNGIWVSNREIAYAPEFWEESAAPLFIANVQDGSSRRFDHIQGPWSGCVGTINGRLLTVISARDGGGHRRIESCAFDGSDRQPFITLASNHPVTSLDIARDALPS
jgi:dipeptidyl aminopeptidase/acylaminoacyl peptidase